MISSVISNSSKTENSYLRILAGKFQAELCKCLRTKKDDLCDQIRYQEVRYDKKNYMHLFATSKSMSFLRNYWNALVFIYIFRDGFGSFLFKLVNVIRFNLRRHCPYSHCHSENFCEICLRSSSSSKMKYNRNECHRLFLFRRFTRFGIFSPYLFVLIIQFGLKFQFILFVFSASTSSRITLLDGYSKVM